MADDNPPLLFKRVFGSLRPANRAAEEAMANVGDKPVRVRITAVGGNVRRNGLYWAVLGMVTPMLSERIEGDALTTGLLHKILKDRYGLVPVVTLPSGDKVKDYDAASTAFHRMTEPERAEYVTWALATLSKWLGVDVEDLRREGAEAA
ncbi:hypothetical protein [Sphingobium sp. DC-2]|uniref:hypothetical protein n=1 Tax=Sphingobium sp. DC-2 TaxID=1303256 RepID=UPI00068B96C3|nr:hypothetical protein [Sphingobium sp. DC-2]